MKFKIFLAFVFLGIVVFTSCDKFGKKPSACFSVSNVTPELNETLTFNTNCTKDAKWIDVFVDGTKIGNSGSAVTYVCSNPGDHVLSITAYSKKSGAGGEGKSASSSLSIFVTAPFAATSNSPIHYGETLQLNAIPVQGATYNWAGPANFSSTEQNPSIANVNALYAGIYTVTATKSGSSAKTATVLVTLLQVTPPCTVLNNVCSFTGGLSTVTLTSVSAFANGDTYQVYGYSPTLDITFDFKYPFPPAEGIYDLNANIFNLANNEVTVDIKPNGFFNGTNVGAGKVYVSYVGGKISVAFCSIPFTYDIYSFTCTGRATEQ